MGDSYWMEDKIGVGWEDKPLDDRHYFKKMARPEIGIRLLTLDSQIKAKDFKTLPYPVANTGSDYFECVFACPDWWKY